MSVFTITRNNVEIYVRKVQVKDLKPTRIKSDIWMKQHKFGLQSYVLVTCNKEGEIKFTHPKQKYKIHKIIKGDIVDGEVIEEVEELLYEDYYTFPIVDYLEETMFE